MTISARDARHLERLITELSQPAAYELGGGSGVQVVVLQTHISVVFLVGEHAYKIKKPVELSFLDYVSLEERRRYCGEELRLNRRLAADIYLDMLPIVETPDGLRVGGPGPAIEYAVRMQRIPDECLLGNRIAAGQDCRSIIDVVARRLAEFHAVQPRGPAVRETAGFACVARNARDNFEETRAHVGDLIDSKLHSRLATLVEESLARHRPCIEARARDDRACDAHGDLRLEHVAWFPDRPSPHDLQIIDCVEFNERFRYADPISDTAFLVMDLLAASEPELARHLKTAYVEASGDREGESLWPFYIAYRSMVRAKVRGFQACDALLPELARARARVLARRHYLVALAALEPPDARPALVLIGGLPGVGKSTLARALALSCKFEVLQSDRVRKELAGVVDGAAAASFGTGIYTPEHTTRTYDECRRRAESILMRGQRCIIDANFALSALRRPFLEIGKALAVPIVFLQVQLSQPETERRLRQRHCDVSDADVEIHRRQAALWQEPTEFSQTRRACIDAMDSQAALDAARRELEVRGLA
ncbi:MAG: AAA family ATPase [Planctomycetota bacterium]